MTFLVNAETRWPIAQAVQSYGVLQVIVVIPTSCTWTDIPAPEVEPLVGDAA